MTETPTPTRPLQPGEKILREKFFEHVAAQADLMDKISVQLLTVELAVPGLYAAILKLVSGEKATISLTPTAIAAFALWLLALLLTLISLLPRKWKVDTALMRQAPGQTVESLGVEDFFLRVAAYKRTLLIAASVCFFAGVLCALLI